MLYNKLYRGSLTKQIPLKKQKYFDCEKNMRKGNTSYGLYPKKIYQMRLTLSYANDIGQKLLRH